MEEKLSDTREQMIRIEGVVNAIHTEVVEIKEDQKELKSHVNDENQKMDLRIRCLEDNYKVKEVTWRTLAKIGSTAVTIITVGIALWEFIPMLFGA
jgi:tetrahydromethanopterin S-methyltransferase subunit B